MTSSPPDSDRLRGLPGLPLRKHDSGERPSWRAVAVDEQRDGRYQLRAKKLDEVDREIASLAPSSLRTDDQDWDDLCKRRAKAALEDAVYQAGSGRELSRLARFKGEKTVRDWLQIEQRVTALHIVYRVPDWVALIFVRHIVRHWGARAVRELIAFCESLLGESKSDDAPWRKAL